jgi:hypothetical protein
MARLVDRFCKNFQNNFFSTQVTRRLAIFLSTELNCSAFYACLLQLLQAYARNQVASKYAHKIDEDKATDLTLMIDMLANILSKDLVLFATVQGVFLGFRL